MISDWRFCSVGVDAELVTTGSSGTAEGTVGCSHPKGNPPQTKDKNQKTHFAIELILEKWNLSCRLHVLDCLGVLSDQWLDLQPYLPTFSFHVLWIYLMVWNEEKKESENLTSMPWVAWSRSHAAVQIWHCCSHWGKKQIGSAGCAKCPSALMATGDRCCAYLTCALIKKRPSS